MRTNIYMDFDGVLNPLSGGGPKQNTGWPDWRTGRAQGYPILWSPSLIQSVKELGLYPGVTIKWLTSWTTDAPKDLAPLIGVGHDWPVLGDEDVVNDGGMEPDWWKLTEIKNDVAFTRPDKIVWLDDDLLYERNAMRYIESVSNMLAISPQTNHGLTRKHIASIVSFIEGE